MTTERAFATPKVRGPSQPLDRTLFDWVGDAGGATNGDEYKPKLKLRDDYPIEYSCESTIEGRGESISEVWFRYEYDLTLDGEQDPTETRREFEWSVLWNVGVELGLYNCSIDMQATPNGRYLEAQDSDPAMIPSPTRVIALGNDQEDQMNMEAETCFSQEAGCRPMKGIMNALYTGDERDAENMVLSLVQKVMTTGVVRVKGVSQVQYIGDRDAFQEPISQTGPTGAVSGTNDTNGSPMRTFGMGIGIAVGTAVVIGLVVGMLVARAVKKRDKDSVTRMSVTSIEIMELDDDAEQGNDDDGEEKSNVEIVESIEEGTANGGTEIPEVQQVNSIIPAAPQSQSLQSKRRRRRKKKKKKKTRMTLTRSNSVNSMDTITEGNEEDGSSDDGSDYGSEYSTDDEDQDCHMKRTMSTGSLSSDPSLATLSFPLEQVKESPRIKKIPPPPV